MSSIELRGLAYRFHRALGREDDTFLHRVIASMGVDWPMDSQRVLCLGLNPSSADLTRNQAPADCFLHYVPDDGFLGTQALALNRHWNSKGWTYPKYFKKPYDLFFEHGYWPIWTLPAYFDQVSNRLDEFSREVLKKKVGSVQKFCLQDDLIPYKETSSKRVQQVLENDMELAQSVFDDFLVRMEGVRPRVILVNNAFVSKFLIRAIGAVKVDGKERFVDSGMGSVSSWPTRLNYSSPDGTWKTTFLFTSMLSGVRALDDFALIRLRRELAEVMNEIR